MCARFVLRCTKDAPHIFIERGLCYRCYNWICKWMCMCIVPAGYCLFYRNIGNTKQSTILLNKNNRFSTAEERNEINHILTLTITHIHTYSLTHSNTLLSVAPNKTNIAKFIDFSDETCIQWMDKTTYSSFLSSYTSNNTLCYNEFKFGIFGKMPRN